jgi:hypothetical protein
MRRGGKKLSNIFKRFCTIFKRFISIFERFYTVFKRFRTFQNTNMRVWCYPKLPILPILIYNSKRIEDLGVVPKQRRNLDFWII